MINVTKTFLPPFDEYTAILKRAWDKAWITNNGELVQELELKLSKYLDVDNFLYSGNGTIVLQMALKVLGITKEVITTPFSYVATANTIIWEGCEPVFVDVDRSDFCIDPHKIEEAITKNTQAILATHVYGVPCDVNAIEAIAKRYDLKVIYDGAHAFGTIYKGKSLLQYGDISTCSFHATKLFHTVEGGGIISHSPEMNRKLSLMRSFGHISDEYFSVGINGKNSEFHAAMGLAVLPYIEKIISARQNVCHRYADKLMSTSLQLLRFDNKETTYNYAYFPVLFPSEQSLLKVKAALEDNHINSRRYFYPSLNTLPFLLKRSPCPVSEDLSARVLCLPLYPGLSEEEIDRISSIIIKELK